MGGWTYVGSPAVRGVSSPHCNSGCGGLPLSLARSGRSELAHSEHKRYVDLVGATDGNPAICMVAHSWYTGYSSVVGMSS